MHNKTLRNKFEEESFEGLLYLATMNEKTAEETLHFMYNKKTLSTSTFQRARKFLMENNALEIKSVLGKKGLISVLHAKPEPYLDYLKNRVKECNEYKKTNLILSDIEIRYLKFIFNSTLFKETFFNTNLFGKPEYAYNVSMFLDSKGKTHAYDIFRWIDEIFISMIPYLREFYNNGFEDLFLDDIRTFLEYEYPDDFVKARISAVPEEKAEQINSYCNDFLSSTFGKYPHVKYMIKNSIANNLFTVFNYEFLAKIYVIMAFDKGINLTDTFINDCNKS
jgi:hypothetical protein